MTNDAVATISMLSADDIAEHAGALGVLMHACVHAGASIGYVLPYSAADGVAFWLDKVRPGVQAGSRVLLVARRNARIVGSVQLDFDTPPNQPHRAEVRKLLVDPAWRRQGIAQALMAELERHARRLGRGLLTLDTRSGDMAEPLYAALGYTVVGAIPGYCVDALDASRLDATTIMFKQL
ncbi:MAG: GNAT family N-acetyltransferase [Pseudomonadota bacterium]|nr:GNAT family N-acetyltransferase [Pseudomonadota bacterium]